MDKVRLLLFGSPSVEQGGAACVLPFERRMQLLVLLALRRGWVTRADLASMLWPEQNSKLAYTNLRKTLFRSQSIRWAAALESQGAALRFEADTDVEEFETALREQRVDDALALYRGELLSGFDDGQSEAWTRWLEFERERLRVAWRGAALERLALPIAAPEAVTLAARLLEADPFDEAALRAQMAGLAREGQSAAARAAYRGFVGRLEKELGLEPGAELRALHETLVVAPADAALSTRATSAAGPAASPGDGFVGRSVELRRIADLLVREECRLLCLVGPGGVGKTRLARRASTELATSFADGAAFVALEDVTSPQRFAARLAREIGLPRTVAEADPLDEVIDSLRKRHALLVLDNFEQLAEHTALLERLLRECTRLKIVVTSRVRLAAADAWSLPLEGLPYPDPEDEDRADAFDAVRLFVQAAQRVDPAFAPAAERAAIVDICRLVGGLPLALEIAAAWVRVLPCEAIGAALREGTELLRAVDPSRPERQASIDVVFEHSWRRLSAVERDALARLSVFRGGFTAPAARAVAGASLPALGALADKSLLAKDGSRLHLHPLVQQLAALRLSDAAARATQVAHALYFHRWLAQLWPASEAGEREAHQAIDADFENCRQAWVFSIAAGQADALRGSAPTLLNHFENRARFEEGLLLVRQAIESPLGASDAALHSCMLSHSAWLEYRLGRYAQAQANAQHVLAGKAATRGADITIQAVSVLAGCAFSTGRLDEAQRHYTQALTLAREAGLVHQIAATLANLALVEKRLGRYQESLRLALEALAMHRHNRATARVALSLSNLGSMYLLLRNDAAAKVHLHEALAVSERDGLVSTRAFVLANLVELEMRADNDGAARAHAELALELAETAGIRSLAGWLKVQLARLAAGRGEIEFARTSLGAAAQFALALGAQTLKAAVLTGLAELLEAQGFGPIARRVLAFGVDEASLSAPDRDELRAELERRSAPRQADPPWPGIELDELLHRVVVEAEQAYAPLLAALQDAQRAAA